MKIKKLCRAHNFLYKDVQVYNLLIVNMQQKVNMLRVSMDKMTLFAVHITYLALLLKKQTK